MSASPLARSMLITGASRGLGLEIVRQIVKSLPHPEILIAACRNPSDASDLQAIAKSNDFIKILKIDVEKDEEIDAAVKETTSLVGDSGLNLLINNAGIYLDKSDGGGVRKQNRDRLQKTFNVNSTSPIIVTQKFLPLLEMAASHRNGQPMSCQKAACVVMSSGAGCLTKTHELKFGTNLDYKCSKAAVNMAVVLMAQDLSKNGILSVGIHPGWVKTDMGGANADITLEESVEGIIKTLAQVGEKDMGRMIDYNGKMYPF